MNDILPHEREIEEYRKTIDKLKKQSHNNPLFNQEIVRLEQKLEELKASVYKNLSAWERVQISRHPARPRALDFIRNITEDFTELAGDRYFGEDQAVVGGLAKINGQPIVVIGQEKGKDTETRIKHNFGMVNPEGFRKALRLMQLAEKFSLPILSLLDTPGANPILEAEERGQGWAIALNLREMARIKTPIIIVVIGEGYSGGALGMGVGDVIGMLEHACYSVISPEGCASILWKDAGKKVEACEALKMTSDDLLQQGIVDKIIKEPLGGAHHDPQVVYKGVKDFFIEEWGALRHLPADILVEERYLKFRKIGQDV